MERELFTLLLAVLDRLPEARRRPAKGRYRPRDVLALWLWAVLHDRPISWAVQRRHWPRHDRARPMPSGATVSRRMREPAMVELRHAWIQSFQGLEPAPKQDPAPWLMDGKPLPVAGHSADRDAGVGRTTSGIGRGYKLHAIVDRSGVFKTFRVEPLRVSEQAAAHAMLDDLPATGGWRELLADANYDSNRLYDHAADRALLLRTPRRYRHAKGLGHQRHSVFRLATIRLVEQDPSVLTPRRRIEGVFATLGAVVGGLGPLPQHVRGLERVRRWVAGKLLIHAAHRTLRQRRATTQDP